MGTSIRFRLFQLGYFVLIAGDRLSRSIMSAADGKGNRTVIELALCLAGGNPDETDLFR